MVRTSDGQPVAGAMVTVDSSSAAAATTTVFSGADGNYRVPDLGPGVGYNSLSIGCRKIGFVQSAPEPRYVTDLIRQSLAVAREYGVEITCVLRPEANVAGQASASAWLSSAIPDAEPGRARFIWTCSNCHQAASDNMRIVAAALSRNSESEREAAWRAIGTGMAARFANATSVQHGAPPGVAADPYALFMNKEDVDNAARILAKYMATDFDRLPLSSVPKAESLQSEKTVIQEFDFRVSDAFVREVAVTPSSPYTWGVDINHNRLLRLNPATGETRWLDIPGTGAFAPHTMTPARDGTIWLTLLEPNDGVAEVQFDPKKETFRAYGGFPKGIATHDFAGSPGYFAEFDNQGYGWLSNPAGNSLVGFNPQTGDVVNYPLPLPPGETSNLHVLLYGAAMTAGKNVWFTQLGGYIGEFDTVKRKVTTLINLPVGNAPRRLAVGDDEILYVPLHGDGSIYVYDAKNHKHLGTYSLPDRNAAPYAVTWDPVRKKVWVANANSNSLYQFDPVTKSFRELPLPRRNSYVRMIAIDQQTADLWLTYAPIPQTHSLITRIGLGDLARSESRQ